MHIKDIFIVIAGIVSGLLSGAFGVGGAVVSTPLIRAVGITPIFAIASTLPAVLPSAITGALRYNREKLINWSVVVKTAPAGIVAAVFGALASPKVPGKGHVQMIVTALLLGYTAAKVLHEEDKLSTDAGAHELAPYVLGAGGGALSGFLGIGGGVVTIPGFRSWLRMSLKSTIATSLVCVGIFAIPSTITHAIAGHISWRVAIELAVGVIPGAAVGSRLAMRTQDKQLRVVVAVGLGVIAIVYGALETRALFV